jgi:hypothetical protein
MRHANGRDPVTGLGEGNESWIGLSIAMIVLDTLSGSAPKVWARWKQLLTTHGVSEEDAKTLYSLRCSLLHGYGPPKPKEAHGRTLLLTSDPTAFALDTSQDRCALLSVPVFCGHLVERIVTAAHDDWDGSLIDTNYRIAP